MKQNPLLYWASVICCVSSLFLVVGNALLVNGNKGLQRDVNARQQQINAGQTFAQIYQGLVQAIAEFATEKHDEDMRTLLADAGIKLTDKAAAEEPRKKKP